MSAPPPFYIGVTRSLTDRRLRRADLCVLGALCSFYNRKTRQCNPGRKAIAARAGLKRTATDRALEHLAVFGYIEIFENWNEKTGAQSQNSYEIYWDDPETEDEEGWTPLPDSATPPLPHSVTPPYQTVRATPVAQSDTPGATQGGPKQTTELRSELRSEQTIEHLQRPPLSRRESELLKGKTLEEQKAATREAIDKILAEEAAHA